MLWAWPRGIRSSDSAAPSHCAALVGRKKPKSNWTPCSPRASVDAAVLYERADLALQMRDFDACLQWIGRVMELPDYRRVIPGADLLRVRALHYLGRLDDAIAHAEAVLAVGAARDDLRAALGDALPRHRALRRCRSPVRGVWYGCGAHAGTRVRRWLSSAGGRADAAGEAALCRGSACAAERWSRIAGRGPGKRGRGQFGAGDRVPAARIRGDAEPSGNDEWAGVDAVAERATRRRGGDARARAGCGRHVLRVVRRAGSDCGDARRSRPRRRR